MTRLTRRLMLAATSLVAVLALPGTAFAMPAPVLPDTGAPDSTPVIIERVTATSTVGLWQLALVALTAAVVAAVAVSLLTRLTSATRQARPQPA
jgi:small-conductance mechanosensitive channel